MKTWFLLEEKKYLDTSLQVKLALSRGVPLPGRTWLATSNPVYQGQQSFAECWKGDETHELIQDNGTNTDVVKVGVYQHGSTTHCTRLQAEASYLFPTSETHFTLTIL